MPAKFSVDQINEFRRQAEGGCLELQHLLGKLFIKFPDLGRPGEFRKWLEMAANNGIVDAYWDLAEIYIEGKLLDQDYSQAHVWLKKGAELNHPVCLYNLGVQYLQGAGVAKDPCKAFDCFRRSADLGDTNAQYNLAVCYGGGIGTTKDHVSALKWAHLASAASDPRGPMLLKKISEELNSTGSVSVTLSASDGSNLMRALMAQQIAEAEHDLRQHAEEVARMAVEAPPEPKKAKLSPLDQLKEKAALGDVNAQLELAQSLRDSRDFSGSRDWLTKAAEAGHAEAQFELGNDFAQVGAYDVKRRVSTPEIFKARGWFEKAAQQGHSGAQKMLDKINAKVIEAQLEARQLRDLAEKGDAGARYELGMRCARGAFGPPDFQAAVKYLELAARQNHAGAQVALFIMYERGQGVARDKQRSHIMLMKAASQGNADAMYHFVRRYADGRITASDFPRAAEIFAECQKMYPEYDAPGSPKKTIEELHAASMKGDCQSLFLLGKAYCDADGVVESLSKGLELLQKAVSAGYAPAQFLLARCYATGNGVPRDMEAGKALTIKAAKQGHVEARIGLLMFGLSKEEVDRIMEK